MGGNLNAKWADEEYEKLCTPSYWSEKFTSRDELLNHFISFFTKKSGETRENSSNRLNVSYGTSPRQKIDYFYAQHGGEGSDKPVFVYVHGG